MQAEVHPVRERTAAQRPWAGAGMGRLRLPASFWARSALIMALAAAARFFVLWQAHGMMDGDEAVLGIQAERILHGARPIYFAGQAYMGAWDAYLAAPLIALFGPSATALHTVTLLESLLLVPVMGALATKLYGARAELPAMLLTAVPTHYVAVNELRALGGYVETLVLGAALLLLAVRVADAWAAGQPTWRLWALVGLVTGAGLWIDPLILYYPVTIALWLLPLAVARLRRRHALATAWRPALAAAGVGIVGLLLGTTPAIVYGFQHHFANVDVVTQHPAWLDHVPFLKGTILIYLLDAAIPRITGIQYIWRLAPGLALPLGALALLFTVAAVLHALARFAPSRGAGGWAARVWDRTRAHWREALPILLAAVVLLVYWRSPNLNTALGTKNIHKDAAVRYALPLTTSLTLMLASLFVALPAFFAARTNGRGDRSAHLRRGNRMALLLLALLLVVYAIPYVASDNEYALQSPATTNMVFPAEHGELLTYLDTHQIRYVWANHWMSHLIMYLTDERITCGDYVDVYLKAAANRFPEKMTAVAAADRPSFMVTADPANGETAVAKALDSMGVRYTSAHFGNVWVITPTSRTVQPGEISDALLQDY